MAEVSPATLTMLLTIAFMSILSPAGLAQLVPLPHLPPLPPLPPLPSLPPLPPGVGANPQCWSSLASIQGCIVDILKSFSSGKLGSIGTACCDVIKHIQADCWPKLFPSNPVFPKGLKTFCAAPPPLRPSIAKEMESELLKVETGIKKCWSSIASVEGCVADIFKSFRRGKIGGFGPTCCKAISAVTNKCWSKIFPIDPFFPPLIKSKCGTDSAPPK